MIRRDQLLRVAVARLLGLPTSRVHIDYTDIPEWKDPTRVWVDLPGWEDADGRCDLGSRASIRSQAKFIVEQLRETQAPVENAPA